MICLNYPVQVLNSISFNCSLSPENEYRLGIIKRIAKASIPIISVYEPIRQGISISSNGYYFINNIFEVFQHSELEPSLRKKLLKATYSGIALQSSIYKSFIANVITTVAISIQNITEIQQLYFAGEYALLIENLAKTGINGLSLFLLVNSSLEILLALAILQMSLALFETGKEGVRGRYIEAIAQFIMSLIHAKTTMHQYNSIVCRNALSIQYGKLIQDILLGQKLKTQSQALSSNLQDSFIKNRVVLKDSNEKEYDFGSYFHGLGKQFIKGNNVLIKEIELNDKKHFQIEFKINQVFRDRLKDRIETIKEASETDIQSLLSCLECKADNIKIVEDPSKIYPLPFTFDGINLIWNPNWLEDFHANPFPTTIIADGLGKINLGLNSELPNLQDKVTIEIEADKSIEDCIELASLISLPEAFSASSQQDIERLKIGHLFRNFFPKEATQLERSREFFDLPIDELKNRIITAIPKMESIFDQYLSKISPENLLPKMSSDSETKNISSYLNEWSDLLFSSIEHLQDIIQNYFFHNPPIKVTPGKVRYKLNGLSQEVYKAGGRTLMSAITSDDEHQTFSRIASVLKLGMLSTELRQNIKLNSNGLSPSADWESGGADSIYTQLITAKDYGNDFDDVTYYDSDIRLLIKLDALELGSYQYLDGNSGARGDDFDYLNRSNIITITESLMAKYASAFGHEIMLKDMVTPKFFSGIVVPNQKVREKLTNYLKNKNLITKDSAGNDCLLNQPISSFIRVGNQITERLIA